MLLLELTKVIGMSQRGWTLNGIEMFVVWARYADVQNVIVWRERWSCVVTVLKIAQIHGTASLFDNSQRRAWR